MKKGFYEETAGIYRLQVPFDDLYTSVFLIVDREKKYLLDCATTAEDVDGYILPALREWGCELSEIDAIVLSHKHADHAGGLSRILELAPGIEIVKEVRTLGAALSTYPLPGHMPDCIGLLDERTATLITADGLQGAGVGKYRCSLKDREAYFQTLERLRTDDRIRNLLFSHAFEPWYSDRAIGRAKVLECLSDCTKYL